MKKQLFLILTIILFLTACISDGLDTIVLPQETDTYLPEEIATTWKAAIKCKTQDDIAFEVTLTTMSDSKNFTAKGTANDYDGSPIEFTVTGTYDKEYNTFSAEIKYDFTDTDTYRIDFLAVDLTTYNHGSYLDLIKIDQTNPSSLYPSCDTEIKLFY